MKVKELINILKKCNPDDDLRIISQISSLYIAFGTARKQEIVINTPIPEKPPQEIQDFDDKTFQRAYGTMSWIMKYNIYLNSERWKIKRQKVLERDKFFCQSCLVEPATQVHHLSYARTGNEPLFDLTSVCIECHEKITRDTRINNEQKFNDKYIFGSFIDYLIQETGYSESDLRKIPLLQARKEHPISTTDL